MRRSEKAIQNDILVTVSALPNTMIWRNNSGLAWTGDEVRRGVGAMVRVEPGMVILANARPLRAGVPGSPDIIGASAGRAIGLEVKTATGRQSDDQRKFQTAFERAGGLYAVVRHPDDAVDLIRKG